MTYSFVVEPVSVLDFDSEDELIDRCKEWNLLPATATRVKTYQYKRNGLTLPVQIVGYVDSQTVVIQFENKQQHCIHPAYLKEMQTAAFGQRTIAPAEAAKAEDSAEMQEETPPAENILEEQASQAGPEAEAASGEILSAPDSTDSDSAKQETPVIPQKKAAASKKKAAVQLPEDKLAITARVKEFTTVPNHFSDNDDEVIIYEAVSVEGHDLAIEEVWSSHSATLKKLELNTGDKVSFEAKIVSKKLTQHPVKYKVNNPSKMKKIDPASLTEDLQ
ncbi:hypothetical protein QW71_11555 [Paenibacillus sp. IHB B 3415]|uniref:hypothetical protein n=1 Tax=Paenibacillus sp. IHB B 3415 TaxID=867080 RepID=UPI0005755787|nr:hypothetical protein [Paenibacillus sp. IHB B 3415]KHL95589.1 hypothetical protein QW71_11555 [Paenibacillus sp. IHB B 3415]